MASVGSVNRFSAIELDDDGNIVKAPAQPSNNSQKNDKEEKQSNDKKSQNQQGKKNNQPQANQAAEQQNQNNNEHHDQTRNRVSDRNRRGRGGVSSSQGGQGPEGGSNGFAPRGGRGRGNFQHRGGYIQDGEKREFDRRSGPHTDRPRGRARKGGMGLGRYSEEDSNRRNRPNRNVEDPTANDQEETQTQPDATQTTEETQASTDNQSTGDNQVAPDSEAAVVASEDIDLSAVVPVEEEDSTLTYDQFVEQKKAKVLADDLNRQLRAVEINDKQWKKVSTAVAPKKKKILLPTGVEVEVDDNSSEKVASEKNSADKKKKVLSLDEFVGTATNTVPISSNNDNRPGPNGGNGGARGGRGRGGRGNGRGGRGGRGRGGLRGPSVAIDDRKAFPDLSASAKKN